jgi:hypothetical protein
MPTRNGLSAFLVSSSMVCFIVMTYGRIDLLDLHSQIRTAVDGLVELQRIADCVETQKAVQNIAG